MEFKVSTKVTVRFADVDSMGHVNNAKFFTYMEQGRLEYFRRLGDLDFTRLELPPKKSVILASIQCDFKSPAYLGETLEIQIRTTDLGRSSFQMEYRIAETGSQREVARGKSSQVYFDYEQQRSIPLTLELRERFSKLEARSFD